MRMRAKLLSGAERRLLKCVGLKIHKELQRHGKPVEWLAFSVGLARSSIREIIAGRSNPKVITLHQIALGLGYRSLSEFLAEI
jgi:hypothetical protein